MLIKKLCPDCEKSSNKKIDFTKDSDQNLISKVMRVKCQKCHLLIKTTHQLKAKNIGLTSIELPEQSVYFHLNKELLYKDSSKESYSDKNFLLIGTSGVHRQKLIKNIKSFSFNRLVLLNSTITMFDEYFDDVILAEHEDLSSKEETLRVVVRYMKVNQLKFNAVFTYDEDFVMMTSYLATELKLPGIPFSLITRIKNKSEFRKLCSDLEITCPKHFLIESSLKSAYSEQLGCFVDFENNSVMSPDNKRFCFLPVIVKDSFGRGKGKRF